jgi:hypothetical protein
MTTLANLADQAQISLNDAGAGTWPQATVEAWVLDAIRDYSQHFSRTLEATVTTTAATHRYDLPVAPAAFRGMVLVEYPTGEDPPEVLDPLSRKDPRFWAGEGYYDVEPSGAASAGSLWISASPDDGETITLTYLAPHSDKLASDDTLTVPGEHETILVDYVVWRALSERVVTEAQSPDTTVRLLYQFMLAAERAEDAYRESLAAAKGQQAPGGWTGPWRSDVHDPIY